jgi:16S rRNA (uracil1498-N3)-methyltransferase
MRISRLFVPEAITEHAKLVLNEASSHYMRTVLRLKKGYALTIFDGRGGEYAATVQALTRRAVEISVEQRCDVDKESPLSIELGLSVSRGERMDVAIQKATELGVSVITPVVTQFCAVKLDPERREQRQRHWQNIIYRACEQCGRNKPPVLNDIIELNTWLSTELPTNRIIFEPDASKSLASYDKPNGGVVALVGPEGGFSADEVEQAQTANFTALGFGPRVLRNETAAMAAVAAMQVLWGDMG